MPTLLASALSAASLHLDFSHEVNELPLLADSLRYEKSGEESFSVKRLAWLATSFSFNTSQGDELVFPDPVVFVPTQGTTLSFPDFPSETITSINFYLGPTQEVNHANPAQYSPTHPLNPIVNQLHWDWQGGYIFLALEGHWRALGQGLPGGFAYHFGNDHNRSRITLPVHLDLRHESRVFITLDPQKLLKGLVFATDGATTHSQKNDPIAAALGKNLAKAFRIKSIQRGGIASPPHAPDPIDLPASPQPYPITLPRHIPLPLLPSDNPLLVSRVSLGEKLFHEPKLSRNGEISCASCHQGKTMTDPNPVSTGIEGRKGQRNSMPLFNLAWKKSFFWDGRVSSLRAQSLHPIQDHLEMDESLESVMGKLRSDPSYPLLFKKAFGSGEITPENLGLAIENFLLTRLSFDSKLDRSIRGEATLTQEEQRGFELFFTEYEPRLGQRGADCFHCHGGALFTDHDFHHNGLMEGDDRGFEVTTQKESDRFKFSTPSLRNVALTAPYMHDGSFATLEQVIEHYDSGFHLSPTLDPNLAKHPEGLGLSEADKSALVAFLKTLTDEAFQSSQ